LQGKLLRVLQEHRVLALGEDHEVPVHARIIAATNRNLEDMVRDQTFRSDLFHRLNVLSIRLPALRERPEDVDALVRHFAALASAASPMPVSITNEFIQALRNVDLPGNVRELENVVYRAMVTRINGESLGLGNLPPQLWVQIAGVTSSTPCDAGRDRRDAANGHSPELLDVQSVLAAGRGTLRGALDLCEQEILAAALRMSRGNRSRAARLLGISARSIFNKMRKHRLSA
jgi:transcriptional regulator with PAS, ATPase and Fis domain